ncbi:MAG: DUF2993 domain-containing protein [Actinobacteria bacterium]|nr:DUF2993 domain-containing protein [Actinomycetota bacterium]
MRKILFGVIVIVALLLAVEVGITLLSQRGMERALSSQYDLPPSLEVSINSFPYLVSLFRNHLGELQLSWDGTLQYMVEDGAAEPLPYEGRVNLYDVELKMTSLLTGKLEIRDISRLKAYIYLDIEDLNRALGMDEDGFYTEDDRLYVTIGGDKAQYRIKVKDDNTLYIEHLSVYTTSEGLPANGISQVETVQLIDLPMGSKLSLASIDGMRVVLAISIPLWEGYL